MASESRFESASALAKIAIRSSAARAQRVFTAFTPPNEPSILTDVLKISEFKVWISGSTTNAHNRSIFSSVALRSSSMRQSSIFHGCQASEHQQARGPRLPLGLFARPYSGRSERARE